MEENAESGANVSALCDVQQSQAVFPTAIGSAVLCLVDLLFDHELNTNNQSIASLTHRIVWTCLTEDAALFLRYFFEKITQKDKKNYLIQYLKRLLSVYIELPPQTAYVLFNYLLGVIMFFVRTSSDTSQEAIASIQTIIWRIATYVNGIVFKDLKQTLRKEQCDPSLLVTANVPSAKKLIVHGPDLSQIPNQFPIYDNTQFSFIIQESFGFFKIPESKRDRFYLFDIKTNQIHLPDTYVRNFYFFRRNFYPQLSLVEMDPKEAIKHLEKAAFNLKVLEQSKVLFFRKLLENTPFNQVNATAAFLHDELLKLPMFPRKALEADFNLYSKLSDRELLTTDMLHKYSWCQLIWSLFSAIDNKTASTWDITLFISVVNGSFVLHSEDMIMIRTCLAIYINSAQHFQHIFATNGFLLIMPTLLKVYSNMQANPVLKNAIEFCSLQFYTMHRIPFILQYITKCVDYPIEQPKGS
ncbi:hypothetical protein BpHYR1_016285 [Brachionus plicatilis]|uniref:Protein UNC80 C-terminal domain-containing protein n=1 Tax=Brachionus plicatilis TaxID=10195 RepID=A0A3M7QRQ1_BRAPC|nr:hypothetical protein BpHYR1_016285 [Brachionus plicatilis]